MLKKQKSKAERNGVYEFDAYLYYRRRSGFNQSRSATPEYCKALEAASRSQYNPRELFKYGVEFQQQD